MSFSFYTMPTNPVNETARQAAVVRSMVITCADRTILTRISEQARQQARTRMSAITVIHEDSVYFLAASGVDGGVQRRSTSLCAHAILTPYRPFVVLDAARDDRFAGNPHVDRPDGIRFYAAIPLLVQNDLPIGTLCVFDKDPRPMVSSEETRQLTSLSAEIMTHFAALT